MFFFSIMYGIGFGLCIIPPLACGWEWFPERKGFVNGIILAAFGFGAFVFSPIAQAIVNPENLKPEKLTDGRLMYTAEIASNVPQMLTILALSLAGLGLLSVIFVRRNPDFQGQ